MRTIRRDIAGAFIFSADNKVLLGKTGVYDGQWVVPGGGIEEGETKYEATRREVLEETGLDIEGEKATEITDVGSGKSEKTLSTGERVLVVMKFYDYAVYLSKPAEEVAAEARDDFKEIGWFTAEEVKKMNVAEPTKKLLLQLGFLS